MLKEVSCNKEIEKIIEYIGSDFKATPYLYVNVIKYGLGTNDVFAWIDQNEDGYVEGIYLLYYDCIHFYTKNTMGYKVEKLIDFIKKTHHKVIMLQGNIGDRVDTYLKNYCFENNYIFDMDKVGIENRTYIGQIAKRDDINEIVDLLMTDPVYFNVYDKQTLSKQLYDRYDDKFSRYFVIKIDNKLVAGCSTYGEVYGFALLGGVIVHPGYRRRGYATDVENYACHILSEEGISKVLFVNSQNTPSLALHEKIGGCKIGTLAKFVKK